MTDTKNLLEAAQAALDQIPFLERDIETKSVRIAELEEELAKRPTAETFAADSAAQADLLSKAQQRIETLEQLRDTLGAINERTTNERDMMGQDLRSMTESRDAEASAKRQAIRVSDTLEREVRDILGPVLAKLSPEAETSEPQQILRAAAALMVMQASAPGPALEKALRHAEAEIARLSHA